MNLEIVYSLDRVEQVANEILKNISTKTIIVYGDLGAGKTTLIKALVKAMGSYDEVSSPTFSIVNEYEAKDHLIYHFDLYRIKDLEEAYNFGIEDYLFSNHWSIIEWPEVIEDIIPELNDTIHLKLNSDGNRALVLNKKNNINLKKHIQQS